MVWTQKQKSIDITQLTGHGCSTAGTKGHAFGSLMVQFSPYEFYGAAARCSHMHYIDPAIAGPEVEMMRALVERYVDDVSSDFAILPVAGGFKDFVKSFFSGTVAATLAYLAMEQNGYDWSAHFESVAGGNPKASRSPDFVFAGRGIGTALVESKGTRSTGKTTFDSTVEAGYLGQVEPHLGHIVNGLVATHGYCIGSWLTSTTTAELLVHHTDPTTTAGRAGLGTDEPIGLPIIQLHNYATAMTLVAGPDVGTRIRQGSSELQFPLARIRWRGRSWITSDIWPLWFVARSAQVRRRSAAWPLFRRLSPVTFALDETVARELLLWVASGGPAENRPMPIEPISRDFIDDVRRSSDRDPGAVFPDGLAAIGWDAKAEGMEVVDWNGRQFS